MVCVSYGNLVWNLALINLAKRKLHMKYGFDKVAYQYQRPVPSCFTKEDFPHMNPYKICDPWVRTIFNPRAILRIIFVKSL